MVNTTVAYFKVHPKRSKEAFAALIEDWVGILVSDGYGVYQRWIELRQTCLAHLIREARGLSERKNPEGVGTPKVISELNNAAVEDPGWLGCAPLLTLRQATTGHQHIARGQGESLLLTL